MIDPNKKYKTRDGREVRIYAVDGSGPGSVHGAILWHTGWSPHRWKADGEPYEVGSSTSLGLIEIKPRIKREVWLNVYESGSIFVHETKEDADCTVSTSPRFACVKVTIDCEEGEGLN